MIKYKITFAIEDLKKPVVIESAGYNPKHAIGRAYPILRKRFGFSNRNFDVINVKSMGEVKSIKVKSHTRKASVWDNAFVELATLNRTLALTAEQLSKNDDYGLAKEYIHFKRKRDELEKKLLRGF